MGGAGATGKEQGGQGDGSGEKQQTGSWEISVRGKTPTKETRKRSGSMGMSRTKPLSNKGRG